MNIQTAMRLIFPPRCLSCGEMVDNEFGLCGPCWRDTPFLSGLVCDLCGVPLPGEDREEVAHCDACMEHGRPWRQGRAAFLYRGAGRRIVLQLKHGDRQDLAPTCGLWMAQAVDGVVPRDAVVVPVPLHRWRLARRRYNQSALLARAVAAERGGTLCPDALIRITPTAPLENIGVADRFAMLDGAITPHPRRIDVLSGRHVLLVDDVMTSGATLSSAARACSWAGAAGVWVVTLARAAKGY